MKPRYHLAIIIATIFLAAALIKNMNKLYRIPSIAPGTPVHIVTHRPGFHQLTHAGQYLSIGFERVDRGRADRHIALVDSHKQYVSIRRIENGRAITQSIPIENIIHIATV